MIDSLDFFGAWIAWRPRMISSLRRREDTVANKTFAFPTDNNKDLTHDLDLFSSSSARRAGLLRQVPGEGQQLRHQGYFLPLSKSAHRSAGYSVFFGNLRQRHAGEAVVDDLLAVDIEPSTRSAFLLAGHDAFQRVHVR